MLYDCSTRVYAAKTKSPIFGTEVHCKIVANDHEEAKDLAKINFDNYIKALEKHHHGIFLYDEIKLNT